MTKIYCLKRVPLDELNKHLDIIKDIVNRESGKGRHAELLEGFAGGYPLYSVRARGGRAGRVLYTVLKGGDIVVCGITLTHDYKGEMKALASQRGEQRLAHVADVDAHDDEMEQAAARQGVERRDYDEVHYGGQFIVFSETQEAVSRAEMPLVLHGAPGTGKTIVAGEMLLNYTLGEPLRDQDDVVFRALYLAPTEELVRLAREHYAEALALSCPDGDRVDAQFMTYDAFLKDGTLEGQRAARRGNGEVVGYEHFNKWYRLRPRHKGDARIESQDCWASFRLCSFFSDVNAYLALGVEQCFVPSEHRGYVFGIYEEYKDYCSKERLLCAWVTPFSGIERYGLVVLDESQTQSGSMVSSGYRLAVDGRVVLLVGDHQQIDKEMHDGSPYARGVPAADLLGPFLHGEGVTVQKQQLKTTHRNSTSVVKMVNALISAKYATGITPSTKGADCYLREGNGQVGEAALIFTSKDMEKLAALKSRASSNARVVVITLQEHLEEARLAFPKSFVLTAGQAIGLGYEEVVCYRMLEHEQASVANKLLPALSKGLEPESSSEGRRGKQQPDGRVAALESWFNLVITACSRATQRVSIVEPLEKMELHDIAVLASYLEAACGGDALQAGALKLVSTPEEWLREASLLLSQGRGVREEALRVMKENVPESHPAFQAFLARFKSADNVTSAAEASVLRHDDAALGEACTTIPAPPLSSTTGKLASKASMASPALAASGTEGHQRKKKKQETKASVQPVASAAAAPSSEVQLIHSLLNDFTEARLKITLKLMLSGGMDANRLLLDTTVYHNGRTLSLLHHIMHSDEQTTLFLRCVASDSRLLKMVGTLNRLMRHINTAPLLSHATAIKKKFSALAEVALCIFPETNLARAMSVQLPDVVTDLSIPPVCIAAIKGDLKALRLLKELGADLNQAKTNGATAAYIAAEKGNVEMLRLLIEFGADLNQAKKNGATPAFIAAQLGNIEVLRLLKEFGADLGKAKTDGATPAYIAAVKRHVKVLRFLKESGADLNEAMTDGATPAYAAAYEGDIEVLRELKALGADLNKALTDGATPVFVAAQNGHLPVVKLLLRYGCDIGGSLIATAASLRQFSLNRESENQGSKILERMELKIKERIDAGCTAERITLLPIDIAEVMGHTEVVVALREYVAKAISNQRYSMFPSRNGLVCGERHKGYSLLPDACPCP